MCVCSDTEAFHGSLQRVAAPVVLVPVQEPACEGWGFKSLLDLHYGCATVSAGGVRLYVLGSCMTHKRLYYYIVVRTTFLDRYFLDVISNLFLQVLTTS